MKLRKKKLWLSCLLVLTSGTVYSSAEHFKYLKEKVNQFENSVIQDFSFAVPEGIEHDEKKKMRLGIKLEEKFTEQKKLFYKAEEGLFRIEDSLEEKVEKGLLTKKEANDLLTSVEYARRIILYTRKSEVHEQYSKIKDKLITTPDLDRLYQKISKIELPGSCKIKNPEYLADQGVLRFKIEGQDQNGELQSSIYEISQIELDQGLLTTRFERGEHMGNRDKMILRFNKMNPDQSVQSFSLFENTKGEFYHAEFFHDDITTHFINIFGLIKIGASTFDKEIRCFKDGPKPASLDSKLMKDFKQRQ